jgi:hypothetical protein
VSREPDDLFKGDSKVFSRGWDISLERNLD